jgi:antitoxin component YwqK of YwqJK toxin-antitoxin module
MKLIIAFLIVIPSFNDLYSQTIDSLDLVQKPKSLSEVVKRLGGDTVVLYYNDRWQLVKPVCAFIFRISRLDSIKSAFVGRFTDYYSLDSTKATEGTYVSGKKEGKFLFYFPNGQLAQTGVYKDDKKDGIWEYYYENGIKRQLLDFKNNEILINEFWDEEGKHLVKSGNGQWFGFDSDERFIKTSGEVLHGRRNGMWNNVIVSNKMITNREKYDEGKFLNGHMFSMINGKESYKDNQFCILEKPLVFLTAEEFYIASCYRSRKNRWEFAKYPGGNEAFYGEIREKLVLYEPIITRGIIMVQTTVDRDGKMTNFKPVSNIGYENELIQVLRTMKNWSPSKINGKPTVQPKIIRFEIR